MQHNAIVSESIRGVYIEFVFNIVDFVVGFCSMTYALSYMLSEIDNPIKY